MRPVAGLIAGVLGLCTAGSNVLPAAAAAPPSVILIVSESLRADHVGAYGYRRDTTPNIDRLAEGAALFENGYASAPCTNPAMANILVSRYHTPMPLPDDHVTMAEFFRQLGYRTAAVVERNPFLDPDQWNLRQGFDFYDYSEPRRAAPSVTDRATGWLESGDGSPFFLWLFYYAPHRPYVPPTEFRGRYTGGEFFGRDTRDLLTVNEMDHRSWRPVTPEERRFLADAYDEEVRYMDHEVGRLLDYLKKKGIYERSFVIFTGDHGEELGDNDGLWDHCNLLSGEELRVPLLVKLPGEGKGSRIDGPVQTIDIFPTLADLVVGGAAPPPFQGRSLRGLMEGREEPESQYAASYWKGEESLAAGGRRYWRRGGREQLLDASGRDVFGDGKDAGTYRSRLEDLRAGSLSEDLSYDETLERIRSLGYLR